MISFNLVPTANRRPDVLGEIDGSRALSAQPGAIHRVLLIGLKLTAGSAIAGVVVPVSGETDGDALFGQKAQLASMSYFYKRIDPRSALFALPVDENAAGTTATATFVLSGTEATKDGTIVQRIGRTRIYVGVKAGDTLLTIGAAIAAAINAAERCFFSATFAVATVTLTARSKGEAGNGVTVKTLQTVAGITIADTQPTLGAVNPSLAASLASLPNLQYDTIVSGLSDAANMLLIETEVERRWGPTVKKPCHAFAAVPGTFDTLQSYGNARNSARSTVMGTGKSPTEPWIWAAQVAARDAQQTDALPNLPRNGLVLNDCEGPDAGDELDEEENNLLLYDGISTYKVDPSGRVMIERLITTYQLNIAGNADATYLSIETVRNLGNLFVQFVALGNAHNRNLLAPDGTQVDPGVPLVMPKTLRGKISALYKRNERAGRVKDYDGFMASLQVMLHEDDVERMDFEAHPRLVNGLVTMAFKLAFQL